MRIVELAATIKAASKLLEVEATISPNNDNPRQNHLHLMMMISDLPNDVLNKLCNEINAALTPICVKYASSYMERAIAIWRELPMRKREDV